MSTLSLTKRGSLLKASRVFQKRLAYANVDSPWSTVERSASELGGDDEVSPIW